MIDTNVHLFSWPFRRVYGDDPETLVKRLRERGVTQAWAGSYEALLQRDIAGVNRRLADACRRSEPDFLVPFGCVNPKLPDWKEDLRRCHEVHRMPGIRLYPNYHGYSLGDPAFGHLLEAAAYRKLVVQIALSMEDTRTQSPLMIVQTVDAEPLAELLPRLPRLRLMLLNSKGWSDDDVSASIVKIRKTENVSFDIAMDEGINGLVNLIEVTSPSRIVFGSHSPFFYFESALFKVRSAGLSSEREAALCERNAESLLRSDS
jgi:hypothetical protein